jgi:hypothetical protein
VDLRRRPPTPRTLRFGYRDVVGLFESGASSTSSRSTATTHTALTEYDPDRLEKLVHPSEQCAHLRNELLWHEPGSRPGTLDKLVQHRFGVLRARPSGREINAIRDVFGDAEVNLGPRPTSRGHT